MVECFLNSIKYGWIFRIAQPTRKHMNKAVAACVRYYHSKWLHSENCDPFPVDHENYLEKYPVRFDQYTLGWYGSGSLSLQVLW